MARLDANSTSQMTCDIDDGGDGEVTVHVTGELDITNVDALASAAQPALERASRRLVVEASDLRFADSSAIALLVRWAAAVPEIELRNASPLLRRVVESMGLLETLNLTR